MREFELRIDEALIKGLYPFDYVPINSAFLDDCLGFVCGKFMLERHVELTDPITTETFIPPNNWPFPQVVTGEKYQFLIVKNGVFYVYLLTNNVPQLISALPGNGGLMEVADFGEYAIMSNGSSIVYYNTNTETFNVLPPSNIIPMMKTMCNFKGQIVGGNLINWHDCDETYYAWSKIGSADFTPARDNEAGYRRCPYGGEVMHVRRLGNFVVGYSTEGVVKLHPSIEPVATFGFVEGSDIGIINQGAMNGDLRQHLYVGNDYNLRMVNLEGNVVELGYSKHISKLESDIIVTYDKVKKHFYISNGQLTYLYSGKGLTQVMQNPSTIWSVGGTSYAITNSFINARPYITSVAQDMNYKGQKTVMTIESDCVGITDPRARVYYYNDYNNLNMSHSNPLNNQGTTSLIVSGNAFKFNISFESLLDNFQIGYIKSRYKMTDLRSLRGVYAPPIRGQNYDE